MLMKARACAAAPRGLARAPAGLRALPLYARQLCAASTTLVEREKGKDNGLTQARPLTKDGLEVKVWGSNLELPEVSKKQAEDSYLDATSVTRAITPPTGMVQQTREEFSKDRFNYVANNLNPAAQYVVMGKHGKVAPVAVSQGAIAIASALVLMSAIITVLYVKKEWKVNSMKELGDRLREKGSARRESLENAGATKLVRTISQTADTTVKANVELIRRPTQQAAESLQATFKDGVVKKGSKPE